MARGGEGHIFQAVGGGSTLERCARCGTSLLWVLTGEDDIVGLAGGCFAGQDLPSPQRMVFTATRHPFVCTPPGLLEYEDAAPE